MQEQKKGPADSMTRLALCAVIAAAAVYAGEKLCEGKHWPLWEKYGPWILENKVQAIAVLAAVLYGVSLAVWPEEKKPELETKESRALEETVQNKAEESRPLSWYQTRIGRIVISIGLFFLFLPIFIWIVIRRKRSKEKQRKSFKK